MQIRLRVGARTKEKHADRARDRRHRELAHTKYASQMVRARRRQRPNWDLGKSSAVASDSARARLIVNDPVHLMLFISSARRCRQRQRHRESGLKV